MRHIEEVSWLDVGLGKDERFTIWDHGRLDQVMNILSDLEAKAPSLCLFLGGDAKDNALQQIFPQNNIKRHRSSSSIKLRYDIGSLKSNSPILFADGDPQFCPIPAGSYDYGKSYPVSWEVSSTKTVLRALWTRLISLFASIICVFADDFNEISELVVFLTKCLDNPSMALPPAVRPRILVVLTNEMDVPDELADITKLCGLIKETNAQLSTEALSSVKIICLGQTSLSDSTRYERLRALLHRQLDDIQSMRLQNQVLFTTSHWPVLFQSALRQTANDCLQPFNLVAATRGSRPVPSVTSAHLGHFCGVAQTAGYSYEEFAPTIASALFMDHYVPRTIMFDPISVFRTLYRSQVLSGITSYIRRMPEIPEKRFIELIEDSMVQLYKKANQVGMLSVDLRKEQLLFLSGQLCRIRTTQICLYCLLCTAQHSLPCGHTICDKCAQLFGVPTGDVEFQFTITGCLYCLYRRPLVVDVLPPTMNPTILAIDGGGVRGVIPLEFLLLIQESLGPSCPFHDLIDLGIGTSSAGGLSILGLLKMGWDIKTCSEKFDRVARQIFHNRRNSLLSKVFRSTAGRESVIAHLHKWLLWFLFDGCYDSNIFDSVLKDVYGERTRIFDPQPRANSVSLFSGTKVGVVAASIAKNTRSFVFGNFNTAENAVTSCTECGYRRCGCQVTKIESREFNIIRPAEAYLEPLVWEAARATAAAPFFFPPAYIKDIGSFQDGGLMDNFAADIARRLCRQIWPSKKTPARVLSMGTGRIAEASDHSPQFRHIFRDGFVRRGFNAWMSSMDTEPKWLAMISQLDDIQKRDYFRMNVALPDMDSAIDSIDAMDDYRNLVVIQPGNARLARDVAMAFLVSRFYFVLEDVSQDAGMSFLCHGSIRCKGKAHQIVAALENLQSQRIHFVTDTDGISRFDGLGDICRGCSRYRKPVSVLVRHLDEAISIYMRVSSQHYWRINGFPDCMQSIILKQDFYSPFGRSDHDRPMAAVCSVCDPHRTRGKRRKRSPELSLPGQQPKRVCVGRSET
ncbi:patatin-like phospholipase [Aspergillus bertholletiae]|uniref:Patatin-like phospholipase n=1 Tax=Aspergillus bertholletiae TaxID=1226010 RepID=A0A5N7AMK5_9EURO|nr:patatin-like phospholipase [Aspergillus bertholletiae]